MKFIGGEDLSEQERERMIEAERQRRWMRYALLPKRDLISAIRRARAAQQLQPGGDVPPLAQRTGAELATVMIQLEDLDELIRLVESSGVKVPRTIEDAWRQLHAAFCVPGTRVLPHCEVCAGLYPADADDTPSALVDSADQDDRPGVG